MKKIKFLLLAVTMLFAVGAFAQTKIGYIRVNDVMGLFPEIQKVNLDTVGQQYVQDTIVPHVKYKDEEYKKKIEEWGDTTKPMSVRNIIMQDVQKLQQELQGYESYVQEYYEAARQRFLQPFYKKVTDAVNAVAKEKGYTHVFSTDVLLVAPESDNLFKPVIDKLGLKIPEQPKAPGAK